MKAVVDAVARTLPLAIDVVDISNDEQLEDLYGLEIPVLFVDGKKAAKYRVTEAELRAIVRGRTEPFRSGGAGGAGGAGR
jgi:hypothetical protein